jgi:bacillithiol system protein YtxJ
MALKQFENDFNMGDTVAVYFLDLLEHRDISNAIASRFGVYHQSPQLLLIKDGKSVYDVSHSDIDAGELKGKI